jgi:hypothetical protein
MNSRLFLVCAFVSAASFAFAQAPAAPQKISIAQGLQRGYANIKANLTEAADKMADADYAWRPSPDIRPYGGQFGHVANSQFASCAAAKGEPNPNQGNDYEKKTTKAEIVKALADSFAYCDPVFSSLTDQSASEFVKQGNNEIARGALLSNVVAHDNEEYGVITVYIRTKNMVPPSTERSMRGRGMGGRGQ